MKVLSKGVAKLHQPPDLTSAVCYIVPKTLSNKDCLVSHPKFPSHDNDKREKPKKIKRWYNDIQPWILSMTLKRFGVQGTVYLPLLPSRRNCFRCFYWLEECLLWGLFKQVMEQVLNPCLVGAPPERSLWKDESMKIISISMDWKLCLWNGFYRYNTIS